MYLETREAYVERQKRPITKDKRGVRGETEEAYNTYRGGGEILEKPLLQNSVSFIGLFCKRGV